MSAKPVNLNRFRKQKARDEKRARADANAARHGVPKAEREKADAMKDIADKRLDGHAMQKPNSGDKDTQ